MSKNKRHRPHKSTQAGADVSTVQNSLDLGVLNDGNVIMNFAELTKHMVFTAEQARKIGQGFFEMATKADILLTKLRK